MKLSFKFILVIIVFGLVLFSINHSVLAARRARVKPTNICEIGSTDGKCSGNYRCCSELEPNESRVLANSIKATNTFGCIMNDQDIDWFRLEGPFGDFPQIQLKTDAKLTFGMELYVDGTMVASSTTEEGFATIQNLITENSYLRVWSLNGTGFYHIEVIPGNSKFVP